MFEPINNTALNIQSYNFRSSLGRAKNLKATRIPSNTKEVPPGESNNDRPGLPSQAVSEISDKAIAGLRQVAIQFSIYKETGEIMIKVVDKKNNEVIREIISREDLERSARFRKYVGRLFNAVA